MDDFKFIKLIIYGRRLTHMIESEQAPEDHQQRSRFHRTEHGNEWA